LFWQQPFVETEKLIWHFEIIDFDKLGLLVTRIEVKARDASPFPLEKQSELLKNSSALVTGGQSWLGSHDEGFSIHRGLVRSAWKSPRREKRSPWLPTQSSHPHPVTEALRKAD
jgi:hypothetical protein